MMTEDYTGDFPQGTVSNVGGYWYPPGQPQPCGTCGRCPTCGNYRPGYPQYPWYPYITWISGDRDNTTGVINTMEE